MKCARCGRLFKAWTIRGITADGYGPGCARTLKLVPIGRRKPRRVRKDVAQIELELTA
jgi:hypothetical protein